jgi:hypothetical protein
MRRLKMVPLLLVGVLAVVAAVGSVVASGSTRRVRKALVHPAAVSHPRGVTRGGVRPVLAAGAAHGGRVIIEMKQTDKGISVGHGLARRAAVEARQQRPVIASLHRFGGTHVRSLKLVNAVAAKVSAAEARRLAARPDVAQVVPDATITESVPITPTATNVAQSITPPSQQQCTTDPNQPMIEPEAIADSHFRGDGPDEADTIADGTGVTVAIEGMNELAGQPDFQRADGSHVVEDAPDYNPNDIPNDGNLDEWFGDASSVAAQGLVTYQYSAELPFSSVPAGCTFVIEGDAPGSTLVDLDEVDPAVELSQSGGGVQTATVSQPESQIVAGIQNAVTNLHADVISESYGGGGGQNFLFAANDAVIAMGTTVVASSGDEGFDNTLIAPADDPNVIAAGGTNTLREIAQAYGFQGWENDQMTTLSSTGVGQPFTSPSLPGKVTDLVASGYGGEAACSQLVPAGCPTNTLTEAFGGTSESAPFIAGGAADVIQAYRDTHGGTSPTPALVKQILTGTATDIDAPAGEQGAGLLNIFAAVRAAQEEPGTTETAATDPTPAGLISSPTQLDLSGNGGSKASGTLSVYNASTSPTKVTATLRRLGPATQLGQTVAENVSAPDPSLPVPARGATAAAPITFTVPAGVDHLTASMIWPDPTNSTILYYILTDPEGKVTQLSYDFGTGGNRPTVPNIQHTEVNDPEPGTWTAQILWGNGRAHLQEPPNVPGSYTGQIQFQVTRQNYLTSNSGANTVTIPADSSKAITVKVPLSTAPGDSEESVQLTGSNGESASVPVLTRTFVPSAGGTFQSAMGTTVGRSTAPDTMFFVNVPANRKSMNVSLNTPDASTDNGFTYELFDPTGREVEADATPTTTLQGADATTPEANADFSVVKPMAGRWLIAIQEGLTTSGKEFGQTVNGDVTFNNNSVSVVSGLPHSFATKIPAGSSQPVVLDVTNTTGVGRTFTFASNQPDIASTSTYISAGQTALVTLNLTPTATVGTVVKGLITVTTNVSTRRTPGFPTVAVVPYTYRVSKG